MSAEVKVVIAGVGGQGAVLGGSVLALSAIKAGFSVRTFGNMGMSRRGGSVASFVNIFKGAGTSATAEGTADLLLGMEPIEALRYCRYLHKDGVAIINSYLIQPSTVTRMARAEMPKSDDLHKFIKKNFKNTVSFNATKVAEDIDTVTMNTVMLGAGFATGLIPIPTETFKQTIRDSFRPDLAKMNIKAFKRGYEEYERLTRGGG